MLRPFIRIVSLLSLLAVSSDSRAATITLGASQDGTIYSNHINRGSGGGNALIVGTNGRDAPRRALIEFDVAGQVPAGAVIQNVKLTMVMGQLPTEPEEFSTIELHRVSASWGEGTTQQQNPPNDSFGGMGQGAPAHDGDVTWSSRFWGSPPTPWSTPGGDFNAAVSGAAAIGLPIDVPYSWDSTAGMVADVQDWLDNPAANNGWILKNVDETSMSTFRVFYSRQTATAAWRPQLTIEYQMIPEPTSLAMAGSAFAGCVIAATRRLKRSST
ncbi:MAG: hypothetical protein C0485_11725 [Pirellula sp.]|nr:hypothetical protein [Pirellula sp.]